MEVVVDNTPKVMQIQTGFAKRNALEERIEKEEKELENLKSGNDSATDLNELEPESAEERTFKKRYGDLRRHSQKQQTDLQKQIDDLKSQLEMSTKQQIKLPKTEEELTEWAREYPDVAKIVETIAIKKAKEQSSELEERLKKIDTMHVEAQKEKAEAELVRLHPDFDEIRDTDDFHNWVEGQPKWIQQALYENETDAVSAARAIDLYKSDKGFGKKQRSNQDSDRDAAKAVRTSRGSNPESRGDGGHIKESDVERMSAKEYETRQEEIVAAIKSGKFIYDLSGPAR